MTFDDHRLAYDLAGQTGERLLTLRASGGDEDPTRLRKAGDMLAHEYLDPIVAIFLVTTMAARPLSALRVFMRTIVICACVLVGFCAIQLMRGVGPWGDILPQQGRPYYSGIFSDPNDLGQLFIISLGFVIYFLNSNRSSVKGILLWILGGWFDSFAAPWVNDRCLRN